MSRRPLLAVVLSLTVAANLAVATPSWADDSPSPGGSAPAVSAEDPDASASASPDDVVDEEEANSTDEVHVSENGDEGSASDSAYATNGPDAIVPGSLVLVTDVPPTTTQGARAASVAAGDPSQPGGAVTWGACGVTTSNGKVVRTFTNRFRANDLSHFLAGGNSVMYCGYQDVSKDKGEGYRHIKYGHESQFENLTFMTSETWRELADRMIAGTLINPDSTDYLARNDTFTYCRAFFFYNTKERRIEATSYPRVTVSGSNAKVITAYPSSHICPIAD